MEFNGDNTDTSKLIKFFRNTALIGVGLSCLLISLIIQNLEISEYVECLQNSFLLGDCSVSSVGLSSGAFITLGLSLITYGCYGIFKSQR